MTAPRTSSLVLGSEIVASLMWGGERTIRELAEATGANHKAVRDWVAQLRKSGVVRVAYVEHFRGGHEPVRFAIQPKPFEIPDSPPEME